MTHTAVDSRIREQLETLHSDLTNSGGLMSLETLNDTYARFRQRFGPDTLRRLDGEPLLELMKGTGKEGLIYWLEFKDDDEFPARFGSIAGGSSLKYGVFRKKETGAWTTGSPQNQREVSTAEAVGIARAHRDQLLLASDAIASLPPDAGDDDYAALQARLIQVAPDVQDSAWGHKYLNLLHPDNLEDFHVQTYQRNALIHLLQQPPAGDGRYLCAGRFTALARMLNWHMNHLTTVLNERNGPPRRYWRIGTRAGDTETSYWDVMRDSSRVSIGWGRLGDLSALVGEASLKDILRERLTKEYPTEPQVTGRRVQQFVHFLRSIQPEDYVLPSDGATVLGVGKVIGPYVFDENKPFPHSHAVEWLDLEEWKLPVTDGLRTTVYELKKSVENLIAIERRVLGAPKPIPNPRTRSAQQDPPPAASSSTQWVDGGVVGQIQDVLQRKGQVILYGPPGTGKTHWAERACRELAALWNFGRRYDELTDAERSQVFATSDASLVRICCFHPGYGYEDFIEGYRPSLTNGTVHFAARDGVFKSLCSRAAGDEHRRYFLIIDEINRGDIPRIFGELLTLLENSKRGTSAVLPLSGQPFTVPSNVFVIGTMNTADRSIALLDAALRRRFGFIELLPDADVLGKTPVDGRIPLGPWLAEINKLITQHVGRDGRHLQIGHSYFLQNGRPVQDLSQLARILREDILPLLEEYCYDDWEALGRILGSGFVNVEQRSFRTELFAPHRRDLLVQAILAATPQLGTQRARSKRMLKPRRRPNLTMSPTKAPLRWQRSSSPSGRSLLLSECRLFVAFRSRLILRSVPVSRGLGGSCASESCATASRSKQRHMSAP